MANRLKNEKSPYLLQHANNPVDWYPWGTAAFEKARQENKPVFLSIGYATCHWCHVMEKESFEDSEAAAALNDTFVCIKVDREERPDIDAVYMAACQLAGGRGGWPLNVLLTPEKKPFFAGTYFPKRSRFGHPGVVELCDHIKTLWQTDSEKIEAAADGLAGHLINVFATPADADSGDALNVNLLNTAHDQIANHYDGRFGGFDSAPKFPTPHRLMFLLRCHHRTGNPQTLEMVSKTLTAMRMGGLWDHVGFGFHRYATDAQWLLPHFEKMLYDQALLALAYLEAYQVTRNPLFRQTAEEIFTYVLRDMTSPQGGFFTAEDADSDGEEGKFYVWSQDSFDEMVTIEGRNIPWSGIFNLQGEGNFADEATHRKSGANILHLTRTWTQWADTLGLPVKTLSGQWDIVRRKLYNSRLKRLAPLKDDKILTDWNGLMIAALALGGRVLNSQDYTTAAQNAVNFIQTHLTTESGRLLHRWRHQDAGIAGQAGDYAYLIMGVIELYRTTFDPELLQWALDLQNQMDLDFWDKASSGYFLTAVDQSELPVRPKELYDGALPSANSVAFSNLLILSRLTGDPRWQERAHQLSQIFVPAAIRQPEGFAHFLNGLDLALQPGQEVVVTGEPKAADTQNILQALQTHFSPHLVILLKSNQNAARLSDLAGFTRPLAIPANKAAAHICSGFSCKKSTADVTIMLKHLGRYS